MTISERFKHFAEHSLVSALVGAVAAAAVGAPISYWVAMSTIAPSQDRQMRLEQVTEFSASADQFLSLGTQIVPRLNVGGDLSGAKVAIADASGQQSVTAEGLLSVFGPKVSVQAASYQAALANFVTTTNDLQGPEQIRDWAEAFDGVVTAQREFKMSMNSELGIVSELPQKL